MELRSFFAPLVRWWWLLAAALAVAAVFSLVAGIQQPPIYRTSTTLIIGRAIQNPNPDFLDVAMSQDLASTYANLATRQPVRDATMKALGLDWLPNYVVRPVANTQLLEIIVNDTEPGRTQAVANELANQLILQSPTGRVESQERQIFINQQLDDLERKIQETQDEVDARQKEMANLTSARQIADTQNQINALQAKLDTLRSSYTDLLANTQQGALNTLSVIEPATLPTAPVGPNIPLMVMTSAAFALAVAVGAVYLLAYLDNTIKSPEEIKNLTDLPMLVGIPTIVGDTYPEKIVTIKQPLSPIAEAYRSLRTAIQFSTIDHTDSITLLVTSPSMSEGKSVTTANLAVVIAQAGHRVLLIDSDLRKPVMHKIFEVPNRTGLTEFLQNIKVNEIDESVDTWLEKVTSATQVEGLKLLTSGPLPPNPSELLGSYTTHLLLSALKKHFDYIVMDSPPVLIVTDAVVLSTRVDGAILVIEADQTQKNLLRQSAERLRKVNANMLGVVVNRLSPRTDGYYNYHYYYYYRRSGDGSYGYGYGEKGTDGKGMASSLKHLVKGSSQRKKHQPKERSEIE